jgi:hypothetical protein
MGLRTAAAEIGIAAAVAAAAAVVAVTTVFSFGPACFVHSMMMYLIGNYY